MPHPRGKIKAAIERESAGWKVEIELPFGIEGTLFWQGKSHVLRAGQQVIGL